MDPQIEAIDTELNVSQPTQELDQLQQDLENNPTSSIPQSTPSETLTEQTKSISKKSPTTIIALAASAALICGIGLIKYLSKNQDSKKRSTYKNVINSAYVQKFVDNLQVKQPKNSQFSNVQVRELKVLDSVAQALANSTVVVCENVCAKQGGNLGLGVKHWQLHGSQVALIVEELEQLGCQIMGQTKISELNCCVPVQTGLQQNLISNQQICGQGAVGASVVIEAGKADLGIGTDILGECRVPSCMKGLLSLRPSGSALSKDGIMLSCPSLETPSLISNNIQTISRTAQALNLPGSKKLTGEIFRFVIATDLFQLTQIQEKKSEEEKNGTRKISSLEGPMFGLRVVGKALVKWADQENVSQVGLSRYLLEQIQTVLPDLKQENSIEKVLESIQNAALTIRNKEVFDVVSQMQNLEASELAQQFVLDPGSKITEEEFETAVKVKEAVQQLFTNGLQGGTILVTPVVPSVPLTTQSTEAEFQTWFNRCIQFNAIASLSGCPTITVPVQVPSKSRKDPPQYVGVAFTGLNKTDMLLTALISKLMPIISSTQTELLESASKPQIQNIANGQPQKKDQAKQGQQQQKQKAVAKGQKNGGRDEQQEKAEQYKNQGNEEFKKRNYLEAINFYTMAIKMDPTKAVYYSNRSQAYLSLMQFQQAEEDSTKSLSLDLTAKALLRRGRARVGMGRYENAKKDFEQVVALEPNNRQAKEELRDLKEMIQVNTTDSHIVDEQQMMEPQ